MPFRHDGGDESPLAQNEALEPHDTRRVDDGQVPVVAVTLRASI